MDIIERLRKGLKYLTDWGRRTVAGVTGSAGGHLAAAVEYLTPVSGWWADDYGREDIEGSTVFFPLVGLIMGLLAGFFIWLFGWVVPAPALGALGAIFLVKMSGGQGSTGLAALGGLLFESPMRRKVQQPLTSHSLLNGGTFLAFAVLLAKAVMLGSLSPWACARGIVLVAVAGRACMIPAMMLTECRAEDGALERVFWDNISRETLLTTLLIWGVTAVLLLWAVGLFAFVTTAGYMVVFSFYCQKKFGGMDGKSLFALGEACEFFTLLILVIGY